MEKGKRTNSEQNLLRPLDVYFELTMPDFMGYLESPIFPFFNSTIWGTIGEFLPNQQAPRVNGAGIHTIKEQLYLIIIVRQGATGSASC